MWLVRLCSRFRLSWLRQQVDDGREVHVTLSGSAVAGRAKAKVLVRSPLAVTSTAQRHFNNEERTKRHRTPNGLTELESQPAIKRRNIQLEPTPSSDESQATRLSIDEETGGLKTDNPFLHDNVD